MTKIVAVAVLAILVGIASAQVAVPEKPAAPQVAPQNAQQFIQVLVKQVENKNPRIRFAIREALVTMGSQAVFLLQEKKAAVANVHVKAFIDRTLAQIKKIAKRKKSKYGRFFSSFMGNMHRDIDRIAMDLNLTFVQMAKLEPLYKKYDKNVKELYAEMKDSGGFGDREAWKDLQDELKLMAEDTRPELEKFLDEKQSEGAMRYLKRSSRFGGLPMMFGEGGSIQIIEGPGGTGMGIKIKKTVTGKGEEKSNP